MSPPMVDGPVYAWDDQARALGHFCIAGDGRDVNCAGHALKPVTLSSIVPLKVRYSLCSHEPPMRLQEFYGGDGQSERKGLQLPWSHL